MKQTRKKKVGKSPNTTTSQRKNEPAFTAVFTEDNPTSFFQTVVFNWKTVENNYVIVFVKLSNWPVRDTRSVHL